MFFVLHCIQSRRLHRARGARAPHIYKWLDMGGTVSIEELQTINGPNCTDRHESAHQNDLLYL